MTSATLTDLLGNRVITEAVGGVKTFKPAGVCAACGFAVRGAGKGTPHLDGRVVPA